MTKQILIFVSRLIANALGLWLAVLMGVLTINGGLKSIIISAFILAILNAVIKPLLIIFTLPLIALSLGFFLVVINGLLVYLLSVFYGNINIDNFVMAMLAGIIIGLVNYIVTILYERLDKSE